MTAGEARAQGQGRLTVIEDPENSTRETHAPFGDEEAGGPPETGGEAIVGATLHALKSASARIEGERQLAETLQRSLLPRLPEVPGMRLAAHYRPGSAGTEVGGDWYDAIKLRSGNVAIVIGDVVGRGVEAAARMAHLQSAVRVYALEALRPAVVLERMNGFVLEGEQGGMVTLLYAILDPDSCTMRIASAAHPPPLVVGADRGSSFAESASGSPLGVTRFPVYEESVMTLDPNAMVLFYTDGLVETPHVPLGDGLERLRSSVEDLTGEPDSICRAIIGSLGASSHDDMAVLAVKLTPPGETLDLTLSPRPESLTSMRQALAQWLRAANADEEEIYEMLVAAGEAWSNAVAHAHPATSDVPFELHAVRRGPEIEILVSDTGQWRPPAETRSSRGLALMRDLMDEVTIGRRSDGTTVTMRRQLRAPTAREGSP